MIHRARALALALVLGWLGAPRAHALDVELDSETSFQAYEVRTPGASAFLARRRLVSSLGLRVVQPIGEPEPDGRRVRISAGARLRLEQDFGEDCLVGRELCVRSADREDLGGWQPLVDTTRVDLPSVWVGVDGLPWGAEARVGRQLIVDPIGFARFDGVSVRLAPVGFLSGEALAGMLVRRASIAGSPAFEPQGSVRLGLGEDAARVRWADSPVDTWVAGGTLRGGIGAPLTLSLGFREVWESGGAVVARRLSASATSVPIAGLRLSAVGVWDLVDGALVTGVADVDVHDDGWSLRAGVEHLAPRFDPGTIWAWFQSAPIQQVHAGGSVRVADGLELGGALRGRRADLREDGEDLDAGVEGHAVIAVEGFHIGASGFLWSGSLGPVAGVALDASRPIIREVAIEAHVTLWHFDDANRADAYGTVVSESLDGVFDLTEQTRIVLELSHAASRTAGHRFRGILWLRVETWR